MTERKSTRGSTWPCDGKDKFDGSGEQLCSLLEAGKYYNVTMHGSLFRCLSLLWFLVGMGLGQTLMWLESDRIHPCRPVGFFAIITN